MMSACHCKYDVLYLVYLACIHLTCFYNNKTKPIIKPTFYDNQTL